MSQQNNFDPPIPDGALGVTILYPPKREVRATVGPDGKARIEITVEQPYRLKVRPPHELFGLKLYRPDII